MWKSRFPKHLFNNRILEGFLLFLGLCQDLTPHFKEETQVPAALLVPPHTERNRYPDLEKSRNWIWLEQCVNLIRGGGGHFCGVFCNFFDQKLCRPRSYRTGDDN